MNWFDRILPSVAIRHRRKRIPEGVWTRCNACGSALYNPELEANLQVCNKCGFHMPIRARRRLQAFLDADTGKELATNVEAIDRLKFKDIKRYRDRLTEAQKKTGESEALLAMQGELHGLSLIATAFEFMFHGGSMGYAVGERFCCAAEIALHRRIPMVCFSASGGARMQEALISLMQMAKTSAVLQRLHEAGVPYISVLTDPVYGGVSASLAALGDVNIAEPGARAGFAGPNIIRDTMRIKELPPGFQSSEFLLEHGAIDMIVPRTELRSVIAALLNKLLGKSALQSP